MDDKLSTDTSLAARTATPYITTKRQPGRPERLDTLLEKRMREFMLARRQKAWRKGGKS